MTPAATYPVLDSRRPWAMIAAALVGATILLLLVRNVINHPPLYDELLHVLAARGVVTTGEPAMLDGAYTRAELFTRMIAATFELRGESLESARLPSLVAAVLLVALTGAWVTFHAGLMAGIASAVLLAMVPSTIELATFARFYSLHALVVLVALIAAFEATGPTRSRVARILLTIVALTMFPLAWHLQPTTMIAAGAGTLGVAAVVAWNLRSHALAVIRARPLSWLGGVGILAMVVAFLFWYLDLMEFVGTVPLWASGKANSLHYYLISFSRELPLLWPLYALAATMTIAFLPRFGLFCTVVLLSAIAVHSIAAAKAMRYVYYVHPFGCAVWGCGFATGWRLLAGWIGRALPCSRTSASVAATAIAALVAINSQELQSAARFLFGQDSAVDLGMYARESDWDLAKPLLTDAASNSDQIVVSAGVKGLYHFGDYAYELNASVVAEADPPLEFGRDYRTGRLAISTAESLAKVLGQRPRTLVVADSDKLRQQTGIPSLAVDLLDQRCQKLDVPSVSRVSAWRCSSN